MQIRFQCCFGFALLSCVYIWNIVYFLSPSPPPLPTIGNRVDHLVGAHENTVLSLTVSVSFSIYYWIYCASRVFPILHFAFLFHIIPSTAPADYIVTDFTVVYVHAHECVVYVVWLGYVFLFYPLYFSSSVFLLCMLLLFTLHTTSDREMILYSLADWLSVECVVYLQFWWWDRWPARVKLVNVI